MSALPPRSQPQRTHPMWRKQRSSLAPLIHAAPRGSTALGRITIASAVLLLGMMLLRVFMAWAEGRLG